MLEFDEFFVQNLIVEQVQLYGHKSKQIAPNDERFQPQFDTFMSEVKEDKKDNIEPTNCFRPKIIHSTPSFDGSLESILNDDRTKS